MSGEVRFDGRRADLAAVCRMAAAEQRRGPDGSGIWNDGWAALGHRRLSIVDLSPAGAQPMVDDALGVAVVLNGCIYNDRELRAELETAGYRFRTGSDTEVLPAAYRHWGDAFPEHLAGMFAVAVVDRPRRRVVLARDRLGVKPLYVAENPGRLLFASSLPALLRADDVDTEIDLAALHHYLTWHPSCPRRGPCCAVSASSHPQPCAPWRRTGARTTGSTGSRTTAATPGERTEPRGTGRRRSTRRC